MNNQMRLVILSDSYPSVGKPDSEAFIHARSRLYCTLGYDVTVVSPLLTNVPENEEFEGVRVNRLADLDSARSLIKSVSPMAIAIHVPYHGTFTTNLASSLQNQFPVIAWIHGYEALYTAFTGYHQGLNRLLSLPHDWRKLRHLRVFLAHCAAVVYVSQWMRQAAEHSMQYVHPHSFTIANPVDCQAFSPAVPPASQRTRLQGVAIRSLGSKYGLDIAIRAYAHLEVTDLTIIGTGPLQQKLESLIAITSSNTHLLARGFPHAEIPALLSGYDYFISPSRIESQGVAMCEAMSCGLPVVATRVGGIPEFVRDGLDGYLVPPEDPAALREAILRLVHDPSRCREMGQNARQHMLELCEGRRIAARELQVLQGVYDSN